MQALRLTDILCHREQRHVSQQLSLAYDRRQIILERSELADKLPGQYVEVCDFADRPLEVRWKGHLLPYRVFSKDQRVSHTATVENKRLGHALEIVKAQQEIKRSPEVTTNSAKGGHVIRNAIRFTPTGQTVELELCVDQTPALAQAIITISDRGPGIPEHLLSTICTPFFRIRPITQTEATMGLA